MLLSSSDSDHLGNMIGVHNYDDHVIRVKARGQSKG